MSSFSDLRNVNKKKIKRQTISRKSRYAIRKKVRCKSHHHLASSLSSCADDMGREEFSLLRLASTAALNDAKPPVMAPARIASLRSRSDRCVAVSRGEYETV